MPVTRLLNRLTFSQELRDRTWHLHEHAHHAGFVTDLLAGQLSRDRYTAMLAQHLYVYEALESVADQLRTDTVAGRFVDDHLARLPNLRADLDYLTGATTPDGARGWLGALPATQRYAERIRATATWPAGFVAHHYVRYLGDLSGGQAVGAIVARAYGLTLGGDGVRFYRFDGVPKPKVFRDEYRARLDTAPWDARERDAVVDEAIVAYRLNIEVFADLADTAS